MHYNFPSLFRLLAFAFAVNIFAISSSLAQQTEPYVPQQLKPWVDWVREQNPNLRCALLAGRSKCTWPGQLELDVQTKGASFRYRVRVDKQTDIELPGGQSIWPLEVEATKNGAVERLVVLERSNRPKTHLERGSYSITGRFDWTEIPESISVPNTAALVKLKVLGEEVANPKVTSSGELWLRSRVRQEETQQDSVRVEVQRLLSDGIPFKITTRLEVRVAGGARDIDLGNVLIPDSQPFRVQSDLPYRLDSKNRLVLQGKPGVHQIVIESALPQPPQALSAVEQDSEGWPTHETWVWQSDESFRSVELSGATAVDPSRTQLRDDWKGRPTFLIDPSAKLTFKQTRRGEQSLAPNRLNLNRTFWLDLDGGGFTIRDDISGTMYRDWRLDTQPEMELGNVKLSNKDLLITASAESKLSGVELRSQNFHLAAASRINHQVRSMSAVGWNHDVDSLRMQLNLPPGWNLFEASGVDFLSSSWLGNWTLLDLFFVLLVAAAAGKLLGPVWGAVALAAMVLGFDQPGAPMQIWVHLLACIALIRLLPEGWVRTVVQIYFSLVYVCLVIIMVGFCLDQIRGGLFPQLAPFGRSPSFDPLQFLVRLIEGGLGGLFLAAALVTAFVLLIMRRWRFMFIALAAAAAFFILRSATSIFFSDYGSVSRDIANLPADTRGGVVGGQAVQQQTFDLEEAPMERAPLPMSKAAPGRTELDALSSYSGYALQKKKLTQVDPRAVVQTGPGLPSWSWRSWTLSWSGPVKKDHAIRLYLISPGVNLLLSLLRVALFLALSIAFINRRKLRSFLPKSSTVAALVVLAAYAPNAQAQSFPDKDLLNDLGRRLSQHDCRGVCASAPRMKIALSERKMTLEAVVHSRGDSAWPIPGPLSQFLPEFVTVDGEPTTSLRRERDGVVWVRIPEGVHQVRVAGDLIPRNIVTLQFSLPARHVEISADHWSVDGLSKTGSVSGSLQFTRKALTGEGSSDAVKEDGGESEDRLLSQWYLVERRLQIGLPWEIETRVTRLGNPQRPAHTKVPLLPGESVTTDGIKVEDNKAVVSFARGTSSVEWNSNLEQEPEINLSVGSNNSFSEVWLVECSPIWRCSFSGIKPTSTIENSRNIVRYQPWPGETLKIAIAKPSGVPGDAVTIDSASTVYTPGVRLLRAQLSLSIRSSQGGWQKIVLPEAAEVGEILVDHKSRTIRPQGRELSLPLKPGNQHFVVNWQQNWQNGLLDRMPEVTLGRPASNVKTTVNVGQNRWLLWASGPAWGPAVLIWGKLIVVIIFAVLLGIAELAPLKTSEWILLGLGLATLPAAALVIPFFWLAALSYRQHKPLQRRWVFNTAQVGLVLLTAASLIVLYLALRSGLILKPDMLVRGNGSSNTSLHWYLDHVSGSLPRPVIISLQLWVWRVVMLAWSTWLVFALLRWLRWGWESFSRGGLWKTKGKPVPEQAA